MDEEWKERKKRRLVNSRDGLGGRRRGRRRRREENNGVRMYMMNGLFLTLTHIWGASALGLLSKGINARCV